eukprot:TRINITY_DN6710_c0_g2_i2.p1 TRINITY_DN6710_c0_g2~~TRINITY_DN6710_c0_g2_i2.p1  ORF type:complete len:533 (+),score=106.26 TRINITY_DN6710_c0_g2_i2:135-1601(+)
MCPSTRKWNISITEANKEAQLVLLEAAKARQAMKPRDLEISVDFECCKFMGSKKGQKRPQTVKQHDCAWLKQKVLTDWRENITELKLGILGNEEFLKIMGFPKLQSAEYIIYNKRMQFSNKNIIECSIFFNAATLKHLSLQNLSSRHFYFKPKLPKLALSTLIIKKIEMDSLDLLIDACSDSLEALEINYCESAYPIPFKEIQGHFMKRLPKLKHLQIKHCRDEFTAILYPTFPTRLVSLRLVDNSISYYGFLQGLIFPNLKFLWFDTELICRLLANFLLESLEVLVAIRLSFYDRAWNIKRDEKDVFKDLKFPKLKELMVEGSDIWCQQLISQNAETLERLTILRPTQGCEKLMELDCDFPNMKMMALRFSGEADLDLVSSMKAKCPASTTILTDQIKILAETKRHAATYPFPMPTIADDLAGVIRDMNFKDARGGDGDYYGDGADIGTILGFPPPPPGFRRHPPGFIEDLIKNVTRTTYDFVAQHN